MVRMSRNKDYLPLANFNASDEEQSELQPLTMKARMTTFFDAWKDTFVVVALLVQAAAIFILVSRESCKCNAVEERSWVAMGQFLYSPAQVALEREIKVFTTGRGESQISVYQGIGEEADKAWGELYNHSMVKIPKSQAALLPNKTWPIPNDEGYYVIQLDVFHQLHCLNYIRMGVDRDYYEPFGMPGLDREHLSHCVDVIRQSLMCSADVSLNVWQWSQTYNSVAGRINIAHSCRNFDKVKQWALDHRMHEWFNESVYMEDDIVIPDIPVQY